MDKENVLVRIYELRDPRDPECKPRYVGITTNSLENRLRFHIYESKNPKHCNYTFYKSKWIQKLEKEKVIPTIYLIEEVVGWKYACEVEKYWIKEFKKQGYRLTNLSNGGEGRTNVRSPQFLNMIYVLDLNFNIVTKLKGAKNVSKFIYNTDKYRYIIVTNCKYGFKTNKKYYVIKEKDYLNNNLIFIKPKKIRKGSKGNSKHFIYNNKLYNTKNQLRLELNMYAKKFREYFNFLLKEKKIILIK